MDSNCSIIPLTVFYKGRILTSYHVNTNISHQRPCVLPYEKEANPTQSPPAPRSAISRKRYPRHLSICDYLTDIRQSSPLSDSITNAQEILVDFPLSKSKCFVAWYNTNKATDIRFGTLQPSN